MGWQWHQLDHIQIICTSLQTDNHSSTITGWILFLTPIQQCQSTKGKMKPKVQMPNFTGLLLISHCHTDGAIRYEPTRNEQRDGWTAPRSHVIFMSDARRRITRLNFTVIVLPMRRRRYSTPRSTSTMTKLRNNIWQTARRIKILQLREILMKTTKITTNHKHTPILPAEKITTTTTTILRPFSGTTRVSRCQKRTSGLYGARED